MACRGCGEGNIIVRGAMALLGKQVLLHDGTIGVITSFDPGDANRLVLLVQSSTIWVRIQDVASIFKD